MNTRHSARMAAAVAAVAACASLVLAASDGNPPPAAQASKKAASPSPRPAAPVSVLTPAPPAVTPSPLPTADPADPVVKALTARVDGYWKTRATTNLASLHPLYEKAFRAQYTPETFARDFRRLNRFAPEYMGVTSVTFEDKAKARARVKVKLRTRPDVLAGQELIGDSEEVWVLEEGTWYHAAEALLPNI